MRRALKFVVLGVVAVGTAVAWSHFRARPTASPRELVAVLLEQSVTDDRNQESRFFTALSALARYYGAKQSDYVCDQEASEGRAHVIHVNQSDRIVVILRANSCVVPPLDTQYILLLDKEGRLLDRLSCAINNRLTELRSNEAGIFRTGVLQVPAEDAAQLVIRYIPEEGESIGGNWDHEITHKGQTHCFS